MAGRDKSGGEGRSEEDRLRDLAARERAREDGRRPPPSFGPSTRAGRERAAARGDRPSAPTPTPAPNDASFDFDFARPSTRVAGGDGLPPTRRATPGSAPVPADRAAAAPRPDREPSPPRAEPAAGAVSSAATATAAPPAPAPGPTPSPTPPGGDPSFAPLRSAGGLRSDRRSVLAAITASRKSMAIVAAAVALLGGGLAMAFGGGDEDVPAKSEEQAAANDEGPSPYGEPTATPLPPETRVVGFAGAPQADELGILGTMPIEKASDRLERQGKPYATTSRPVLPAFDLIATIANAHPGPGGKYRTRQTGKTIARYLRAARRHDAALILDVQPGTSNFVDELKPLEKWLKEPDVHLALDPEWRMRPGVQPGSEIGWVSAGEVTATLNRVARIVRANDLPDKLVIVHRFTDGMIRDLDRVDVPEEIVGVISIDGVGDRTAKIHTYDRIAPTLPKPWLPGFKVFYEEDAEAGGIMYGSQVMHLKPRPHVVLYE